MIKQLILQQLQDWIGEELKTKVYTSGSVWIGMADPMCGPHNLEEEEGMGPFREMRFMMLDVSLIISVIVDSTQKTICSLNYADPQFLDKLHEIVEHGKMWVSFKRPYPTRQGTELI